MNNLQAYRIATLNITSIRSSVKLDSLKDFLYAADVDIALLQEVTDINLEDIYGYNVHSNAGNGNALGTAILTKEGIIVQEVEKLTSGRGIACTIHNTRIINVYAPSGSNNRRNRAMFFKYEIVPLFRGCKNNVILAGDFNCVLSPKDQVPNFNTCIELDYIIRELRFTDTWEYTHGDAPGFTFITRTSASRLDRIYVANNVTDRILHAEVWPTSFTDHAAYICVLNMERQGTYRARGYWKLNVRHLYDVECHERFNKTWEICEQRFSSYNSALSWWLSCAKPKLRRMLIDYSKEKAFWYKKTSEFYFQCLRDLYKLDESAINNYVQIKRIKAKILSLKRKQLDGYQVRARMQNCISKEETSIFHIIREKKRGQRKIINEIKRPDGTILTAQNDIKTEIYNYFAALMTGSAVNAEQQEDLLRHVRASLSTEASNSLTAEVDEDDLETAIVQSSKNKSPGPDGLPAEFYQVFYEKLKSKLLLVCKELMDSERDIPEEFLAGVVVLIPKNPLGTSIGNLRPITLLNSDYKIMTRILARRLKMIMHEVTGPYQTAVGKDRSILQTVCEYRDVIATAEVLNINCALMTLDFEKAFDRVNHEYLFRTMYKMGFPQSFVNLVRRILKNSSSKIMVNGQLTKSIHFKSSVRQGCPMSMALFAIAIEPLLATLEQQLQGLHMNDQKIVCKAYADDVGLILTNEDDVRKALAIVNKYELASGAKLSRNKSSIMNIGGGISVQNVQQLNVVDRMKILGIEYRCHIKQTIAVNYRNLLASVRASVRQHSMRYIDEIQKSALVNLYIISKINYVAQVLPMPRDTATRIMSALGHFISRGNLFKVKFDTLTLSAENGGLNLIDILMKSKALFVCKNLKLWKKMPNTFTANLLAEIAPPDLSPPIDVRHIPIGYYHFQQFLVELSYLHNEIRELNTVKVKTIYEKLMKNKHRNVIEQKYPNYDWKTIWSNISSRYLPTNVRATWYKAVNRKIATNSKLHRIHLAESPNCPTCNLVDTEEHRLVCIKVHEIWQIIRQLLAIITRTAPNTLTPADFLNPSDVPFPATKRNAVNWIKGHAVHYILTEDVKSKQDFQIYLTIQHQNIMNKRNYKQIFANFLKNTIK